MNKILFTFLKKEKLGCTVLNILSQGTMDSQLQIQKKTTKPFEL